MPTLYVRNVPEDLQKKVKQLASRKKRAFGAEVISLLEEAVRIEETRETGLEALDRMKVVMNESPLHPNVNDSLGLIKEDRNR